jgi:alpha-methylacyl-CoA racemase
MDTEETSPARRLDPARWPRARRQWTELFATRTRQEWANLFEDSDACVSPVLDWDEAAVYPQLSRRGTYVECDGVWQAAPAPRMSGIPASIERRASYPGEHTDEVLLALGRTPEQVAALHACGAVA